MKIGIILPQLDVNTHTFIRAHIGRLPGEVEVLNARGLPGYMGPRAALDGQLPLFDRLLRAGKTAGGACLREIKQRRFARYLAGRGFDAILAEFGTSGVRVMRPCVRAGVPLVVHFHGYDAHRRKTITEREGRYYPELFQTAKALICVSRHMEQRLLELGAPAEKLHVIPYGIDLNRFHPAPVRDNPPCFIAVGRFVDKKAPYLTLAAFRKVLDQVPEAQLKMIGDGPLREATANLARALDCSERVTFLGSCPPELVLQELQGARAFVQHSLSPEFGEDAGDCEGLPLAVLEASASGLPVVATVHAGIAEAVLSGETGYLVPERSVDEMAEKMVLLARDPGLAEALGRAGRKRAEMHYSIEQSITRLSAVMQSAVDHRPA